MMNIPSLFSHDCCLDGRGWVVTKREGGGIRLTFRLRDCGGRVCVLWGGGGGGGEGREVRVAVTESRVICKVERIKVTMTDEK